MSAALDYLVGIGVTVVIAAGWLAVQTAWRRNLPEGERDGDALAGRLGCHGCGECENDCERAGARGRRAPEEVES
jgi:ferredoxin